MPPLTANVSLATAQVCRVSLVIGLKLDGVFRGRRLAVLLLSGRVGPNTRVWREGFPGPCDDGKSWVPVAALLGVQPKWFTEADAV